MIAMMTLYIRRLSVHSWHQGPVDHIHNSDQEYTRQTGFSAHVCLDANNDQQGLGYNATFG